ncbi:MAG: transcription elongation factor GreA [Candidatus Magasanikbacteria bacterium CG_4_9_14_0_2_um_filter_42_11]|uniref:Transcription elongation factor GreA n=1 Tax=Candidatus Magasanikbacteria bacterium CG_4_9_14_0_2_um_filter_42_11 TaxID=1974643 RepID=A0A2M8F948_9BACT|nr:MAG: transcription elongation factor GreA [Candidatus Magasanikbacteria bacterium CG10_big_fil_rev_8_21_14_0_10_43_9]PJC52257.1 MAG: transcription elongation factor GreA [Candidatus Magasanikbacteria bacterium CG_4_9_14_0_2_um_filter_42_11]
MQLPKRKPGKYTNLPNDPLMTGHKFAELKQDLERLMKKRPHAASEVARLAELGDFSENVEYQLAKGRLRGINNAILKIERQISDADIIAPPDSDEVYVGSTVVLHAEGKEKIYTILGSTETNPSKGIISHTSPIGAALLGKKKNDIVDITLRDTNMQYTITDIR